MTSMMLTGKCFWYLLLLGLLSEVLPCFCAPVSSVSVIQLEHFFQIASTLNNTTIDPAQISNHQVSSKATLDSTLPSTSCARFCMSQGAACNAFSVLKFASGAVECRTSSNTATVELTEAVVYQLGGPSAAKTAPMPEAVVVQKPPSTCQTSSDCPVYPTCSGAGTCSCPSGFELFNNNANESCTPVPPLDSFGFQHYPDGFAYKRAAGGASSLAQARAMCSSMNASLPIPYSQTRRGAKSLHQALRTFARPGEEFYIGMTGAAPFSARRFITDQGAMLDAKVQSRDKAQFWAPGEPNAVSDLDAAGVTMTTSGWQDKPNNTPVNTVICSKWADGYTFNSISGKYYKMNYAELSISDADLACRSEGGTLAVTYGSVGKQILEFYLSAALPKVAVAGTDAAQQGQWVFPDGTVLDIYQRCTDLRQHWRAVEPNGGNGGYEENCIIAEFLLAVNSSVWADYPCSYTGAPFLCERNF